MSRRVLGRGLGALITTSQPEIEELREVDIERIHPNSQQPRKAFDAEALQELARSIETHGVVQPLVVRESGGGNFVIIAGERRWRAAQAAGLKRVPVVVRDSTERADLEIALIENLQREDLNPIEEGAAYERLINAFGLTQEEVSRRVGKSRATIANMLRLLRLPGEVQQWIRENRLSTGHAKALLALNDLTLIVDSARKIIQGHYSVRQAEALVARYVSGQPAGSDAAEAEPEPEADPNIVDAIHRLEVALGTKVSIHDSGGRGKIEIHFFSKAEMHRLYDALLKVSP